MVQSTDESDGFIRVPPMYTNAMAQMSQDDRSLRSHKIARATNNARLIGFNDEGNAAVWSGGYTFNVYDASGDWSNVRVFTSGKLTGLSDYDDDLAYEIASERMSNEGFEPIR
jgi:hypothetical protein